MTHKHAMRWTVLAAAAALGLASLTASPSGAADPSPAKPKPAATYDKIPDKLRPSVKFDAAQRQAAKDAATKARSAYFVRFKGAGAAALAKQAGGGSRGVAAAKARRAEVSRLASGVLSAARGVDAQAASIYTISNAVPATALLLNVNGVAAVAANPNVARVTPLVPKTVENKSSASLIKAVKVWRSKQNRYTGKGVTIGVIDTGVDYTHADFGGVGTVEGFEDADETDTSPLWFQDLPKKAKKKFAGGYDFSGDDYDASGDSGPEALIPKPDNNPLDCNGHGTHVAGTAAGYGVTASGKTLRTKKLKKLNAKKLMKLDIGPGMAPQAKIYALRVFGCEGSTNLVAAALDRALDPNGDGRFSDHLDIINASLGSSYGPQDDPENEVVNVLAAHGVVPAMSIGNEGDLTDVGGSPGNATASIASASSVDKLELLDQIRVNAPASVAGLKIGQMSVAYDWLNEPPVTGTVASLTEPTNLDGCDPFSPADAARVAGKVAWLEWDDNDATRRCGSAGRSQNAEDAGAIGVILTSSLEVFPAGITGDEDIPVFQLTKSGSDQLRPHAQSMTLNVTFDGSLQASYERITPANTDTISGFTSRGPRGTVGTGTVIKPDVAAPGDTIGSANVGTGNRVLSISGTSMASPHTAGVAALVKEAHPKWSPLKIKTAIMNTARHDLWTGPNRTGHRYGPARVGAGRIDAKGAVGTKLLAWTVGPNNPVSASFGAVEAAINGGTVTRTKTVKVKNLNKKTVKVKVSYQPIISQPGVSYSVSKKKLKLKKGQTKKFRVTMSVNPTALRHTIDPTMEVEHEGFPRQFVSDASGRLLVKQKGKKPNRVPVYGSAKPTSATTVSLSGNNLVVSGQGFNTGNSPSDWTSLLSVMELGATSPALPECEGALDLPEGCATTQTQRSGDISHVGTGRTTSGTPTLYFGMASHADWNNMGTVISPEVWYDTTGTPAPDFVTFVAVAEATDLHYAWTLRTSDFGLVDVQPINFLDGDVDTNVFDNNVVLIPVRLSVLGPITQPITYTVETWNAFHGVYTDVSPVVSYNSAAPNVATADPLYVDTGGTTIPLNGTRAAPSNALVFHLHGARGRRVEVIPVP